MSTPDRDAVHQFLLGLAGRLPDDDLAMLRTCHADDELDHFAEVLGAAVRSGSLPLTDEEMAVARRLVDVGDAEATTATVPPPAEFARPAAAEEPLDRMAVAAAGRVGGLQALWRATRADDEQTVPVLLGEADAAADVVELVAEAQHALAEAGEVPRVEIFTENHRLSPYHENALREAVLVWQAEARPDVRLARVFDSLTEAGEPRFSPAHPRLDGEDRQRVRDHLAAGQLVLEHTGMGDDVLRPDRTGVVPVNYRSDGTWVWSDMVLYYLDEHGIAPEPDLVEHAFASVPATAALSRLALHRVYDALSEPHEQEHPWRES